jgi:UDP-N-acetylmuramoyl-L-alanyl-D-glutamate--2,6-diaminopimelate ligase
MQLRELIADLAPLRVEGDLDTGVTGIAYDSRRVFPGMLFVALPGSECDGHDHIHAAIDRGACGVVCERNGFGLRRAACIRVADTRAALARASASFYGHPSRELGVIGITGTHGKTTVAFLLQHILAVAGRGSGLISTVRYDVGGRTIPAQRSTPEALDLQCMMAQMARAGSRHCILEVSSHALAQRRVDEVEFGVGVFTNLGHDHLDYHGSAESYYASKRRLFELLGQGGKPGVALLNTDDPAGLRLAQELPGVRRLTYGLSGLPDIRGQVVYAGAEGSRVEVMTPAGGFEVELPLLGSFNVSNALAASGVALAMGVTPEVIRQALSCMPQVPGRLERVEAGQPFRVVVDYAHTEQSLGGVLSALREVTQRRLVLVFGCGGERDHLKRAAMGRVAGRLADAVVVTTDNPRREDPERIAAEITTGFEAGQRARWRVELDRGRAIEDSLSGAQEGDTVLIAGKGHEAYQERADTVVPFDDRLVAMGVLEGLGWRAGGVFVAEGGVS